MPFEDEITARQMPYDLEAEQSVLGAMLTKPDCIKETIDKLRPEDFFIKQNRDIFETIYRLFSFSRAVDPIIVADEMQKSGLGDDQTIRPYMAQLLDFSITTTTVPDHVKILQDKALLRALAKAAGEITGMVREGLGEAQDILEASEQKVYAIRRGRSSQELTPVAQIIKPFLDHLNDLASGKATQNGLSSGFSILDQKIHGLNKSDLILLAARPGVGKSSFAMNMALNVARQEGKTVAVFSLEMSKEQLLIRLMASEAMVEMNRLLTGRLSASDWGKLTQAARTLRQTDIRIDDNPMLTVADMNAKCRRLDNLGLVVVDYLQLMSSSGGKSYAGENRQQAVSDISRMMKVMAKELDVPVICLSQLSRANEKREDKRPMLSDLRDSGAIEQDADIVMFLYREDYYKEESENKNMAECILAKNRHGETGKVYLRWTPEYVTFSTLEMRFDDGDE